MSVSIPDPDPSNYRGLTSGLPPGMTAMEVVALSARYRHAIATHGSAPLRLAVPPGWHPSLRYVMGSPVVYDARMSAPLFVRQA